MRECVTSVPVKTETRNAIRAQKTGGQTYDDVVRTMAALYIQARQQAEGEMSGRERIQARASDLSPVEYVHDLDVDAVIAQANRKVGAGDDDADTATASAGGTTNDVADAALGGRERVEADRRDQSPEEFIWEEYGLDASNYSDPSDLRDEITASAQDQAQASAGTTTPGNAAGSGGSQRLTSDDFDDASAAAGQQGDGDDVAAKALTGQDRVAAKASDQSPAAYIRAEYGVDPANYDDAGDLRADMGDQ